MLAETTVLLDDDKLSRLLEDRRYDVESFVANVLRPATADGSLVAVYENQDFGHPDFGTLRFFPFAPHDSPFHGSDVVPTRLPDFDGQVNWRWQLSGVYRAAVGA